MFYLTLAISFLVGGLPFGLLAGYLSGHGDIRRQGSENIGATNVLRVAGPIPAIGATIGDVGKGVAVVFLCFSLYDPSWSADLTWLNRPTAGLLCGIAAVLGHSFSPFLKFKGGKGVNTTLGLFLVLLPLETIIAVITFALVVFITRYISLGSLIGMFVFTSVVYLERFILGKQIETGFLIASASLTALIVVTHRKNIKRLLAGNENRFKTRKAVG